MATPPHLLKTLARRPIPRLLFSFSLPTLFAATMSTTSTKTPAHTESPPTLPTYPTHPFHPPPPGSHYPYTPSSFTRLDPSPDPAFYATPRFVTHIDDAAIARLRTYYRNHLPPTGKILDLCSSWVSHLPASLEARAARAPADPGRLEVVGLGLNKAELAANPVLGTRVVQDLNATPEVSGEVGGELDATVCVVSIDYLTRPVEVLRSVLGRTKVGGTVHLVVSNRCFPTKVVGPWLQVGERERLEMVAGYVWWAGWRGVEIVDVVEEEGRDNVEDGGGVMARVRGWIGSKAGGDPLWVVRGVKVRDGEDERAGHGEL